jgi:hypothetical protein
VAATTAFGPFAEGLIPTTAFRLPSWAILLSPDPLKGAVDFPAVLPDCGTEKQPVIYISGLQTLANIKYKSHIGHTYLFIEYESVIIRNECFHKRF